MAHNDNILIMVDEEDPVNELVRNTNTSLIEHSEDDILIFFSSDDEEFQRLSSDTCRQSGTGQPLRQHDDDIIEVVEEGLPCHSPPNDGHNEVIEEENGEYDYSPQQVFFLRELRRMDSQRYRVSNIVYLFGFLQQFLERVQSSVDVEDNLSRGFDSLVAHLGNSENIRPQDIVTLYIHHHALNAPVAIPFVRFEELTGDIILRGMEHVAQSNTSFTFDSTMTVRLHIVRNPAAVGRGNGRLTKKELITLEAFTNRKTTRGGCLTKIENSDNLCLGRAIAVALYFLKHASQPRDVSKKERRQRYTEREAFLRDAGVQTIATHELYRRAGLRLERVWKVVPLGGLPNMSKE
ncbi:uncharacterized protein LOC124267604 [Haliotis rubra]|uniref:uncharacterized protein LOC124267604 n=1 Tax=Haliotis rubra TaxID=36100 RepID=UPI001EE60694|nr:uncharacterized protein LOC124267604 [Haliotis rubra]